MSQLGKIIMGKIASKLAGGERFLYELKMCSNSLKIKKKI